MYICNKCGTRLDSGETCECGGRAVRNTWQAGYSAARGRKKKAASTRKYKRTMKYEICKKDCKEPIREYADFNTAFMSCIDGEYVKTTMILTAVI